MSTGTYALDEAVLDFVTGKRILDVGCGFGRRRKGGYVQASEKAWAGG